jgi:hypothetical protein
MDNEKQDKLSITMFYLAAGILCWLFFEMAYRLGQTHCDCKDKIWQHEYKKEADAADSIFNRWNEYFLQYEKQLNKKSNVQ